MNPCRGFLSAVVALALTGCHLIFPFGVRSEDGGGAVDAVGEATGPPTDGSQDRGPATVKHAWSKGLTTSSFAHGHGVAMDSSGNVYATGYFIGTLSVASQGIKSSGGSDFYVVSFAPDGTKLRWAKGFGSPDSDNGLGIAVDGSGNVYVVGGMRGSMTIDGNTLTSLGGSTFWWSASPRLALTAGPGPSAPPERPGQRHRRGQGRDLPRGGAPGHGHHPGNEVPVREQGRL